ncbi:MAG: VCBS repeat-containing protein [Myxococcales bacterium]|nr:VCBS repeat-containing protein [Myxococcales bacterium]
MSTLRLVSLIPSTLLMMTLAGCGGNSPAGTGSDGSGNPIEDAGGATADGGAVLPDLTMPPQTCGNGKKDGDESDLDCGGSCLPCANGKGCGKPGDCVSAVCTAGACAAPTCSDGAKNGDETDVDCGGPCPKCKGGKGCKVATDCATNVCNGGLCAAGPLMFAKGVDHPAGKYPWGIVAVDVNEDKKLDLAISSGDGLRIFLGKGDGTFDAFATFGSPSANSIPGEISTADFNKDGHADLVWPDFNNDLAYIAIGKGDGTFPAAKQIKVKGGPQTAVTGDFDGDGRADVAMGLAVGNGVAVMTGNGDGTFGAPATYPSGGTNANCVGAIDLDGDGKQDIVVGNTGTNWMNGMVLMKGSVFSLINMGAGTFKPAVKLFDAGQPTTLVVRDFDGDGRSDFAFTDFGAKQTLVSLKGAAPAAYGAGATPLGIASADLSLDGKLDLVVSSYQLQQITIFPGMGGGAFGTGVPVQVNYPNPGRVTTGDFNSDGKPDIVLINFNANMMPVQPVLVVVLNTTT